MDIDLRKKENLHVVFWLVKDFAWLAGLKWLGLGMAVPTVLLSYWLTYKSRSNRSDFFHNMAVSFWITGNSMWMAGEFYFDDTKRHLVIPVFVAGLTVIGYFYLTEYLNKKKNPA
ncbi:MAG: hypothetical protein FJ347_03050 [Sphingomonadales bacterium]|nr:hypothetical protein [Sphingomonadales bacterium]